MKTFEKLGNVLIVIGLSICMLDRISVGFGIVAIALWVISLVLFMLSDYTKNKEKLKINHDQKS